MPNSVAERILQPASHRSASSSFGPKTSLQHTLTRHRRERSTEDGNSGLKRVTLSDHIIQGAARRGAVRFVTRMSCTCGNPTRIVLIDKLRISAAALTKGRRALGKGTVRALRGGLRIRRNLSTLSKVCSLMTLLRRGRKGSGDLPGLQSRRSGPSRAEWWIRLPHASARSERKKRQRGRADPSFAKTARVGHPLLCLLQPHGLVLK
jgi:hypothetical protein